MTVSVPLCESTRRCTPTPHSSPTSAALAVDIRRFPWIRRFATDYAFAFDRIAPYFAGNPAQPDAWAEAIARRQRVARTVCHRRRATGASDRCATGAARVRRRPRARPPNGSPIPARSSIITGQQAGLFGGPLFTLLKALTAMKLAAQVAREHRAPVVPVFWIDAEDHDWAEVSGCTVLDADGVARRIQLASLAGAGDLPIGRLKLDQRIADAIDALAGRAFPIPNSRRPSSRTSARAYTPGHTMAEAFGRWIEVRPGPARPGRLRLLRSGREASRLPGVRARAAPPRPDRPVSQLPLGNRSSPPAITPRSRRTTAPSRSFI